MLVFVFSIISLRSCIHASTLATYVTSHRGEYCVAIFPALAEDG